VGRLLDGAEELSAPGRRSRVTVIGLIDARTNGSVAAAEQSVSAAGAPASAARQLGCEPGQPLLRIDRLYFDGDAVPVELAVSYFDPEYYSYRVRLKRRSP
jgi:GntR family transcriptional regulator